MTTANLTEKERYCAPPEHVTTHYAMGDVVLNIEPARPQEYWCPKPTGRISYPASDGGRLVTYRQCRKCATCVAWRKRLHVLRYAIGWDDRSQPSPQTVAVEDFQSVDAAIQHAQNMNRLKTPRAATIEANEDGSYRMQTVFLELSEPRADRYAKRRPGCAIERYEVTPDRFAEMLPDVSADLVQSKYSSTHPVSFWSWPMTNWTQWMGKAHREAIYGPYVLGKPRTQQLANTAFAQAPPPATHEST